MLSSSHCTGLDKDEFASVSGCDPVVTAAAGFTSNADLLSELVRAPRPKPAVEEAAMQAS